MSIYLSILTDHSFDSQDADELEDQSNVLQHSVMRVNAGNSNLKTDSTTDQPAKVQPEDFNESYCEFLLSVIYSVKVCCLPQCPLEKNL